MKALITRLHEFRNRLIKIQIRRKEMPFVKIKLSENKNNRESKQIISYEKIISYEGETIETKTPYIEGKNHFETGIPLEQVTENDIPNDDELILQVSTNGEILEMTTLMFEKLEKLFNKNDAYIYDEWHDVPIWGLGI